MATVSKNFIFNNPNKAFYGTLIIFGIVIGSLIMSLWDKYTNTDISIAENQLLIINNYLISTSPSDTTTLNNITNPLQNNRETTIDKLFFSIYNKDGELLYTNTSSSRNSSILSFDNIDYKFLEDTSSYRSHFYTIHDEALQKYSIISTTYDNLSERFLITECAINDSATILGFIKTMSKKLILIFLIILIAAICLFMLYTYISNIIKLKEYILQLSYEDDFNYRISKKGSFKNLTNDLYTLYRNKIEIIKQHDIEREQSILEEKARLHSKRTLANNLNHEIKTPIGIILGYLDTLINHHDIDEKTRQMFLKKCLQNTKRLQNMVVNIAVISRLEDGSNNIALEDINIWDIANLAKEDLKFTLSEHNMTFKNDIIPDTFVRANDMLIYNVLCNLIKNSCFYSHGSDISLKILSQNEKLITFSFSDNGKGVPEESLSKLFNRFYRIEKDKNKKSGTGIGLSIVQESIKLCGGTVSVNNRQEGGLEYIFTLPPA